MPRVIDKKATEQARTLQSVGISTLNALFRFDPRLMPFNQMNGHAVSGTRVDRLRWRQWRDSTFPARVVRRRRRKVAAASRRKNR